MLIRLQSLIFFALNLKLSLQSCDQYIDYVTCSYFQTSCTWSENVICVDGCSNLQTPDDCALLEDCEAISLCQENLVVCSQYNSRDECESGSPLCYFDKNYSCQMNSNNPCKYLNDTECALASDICSSGSVCRRQTLNPCSDYNDNLEECDGFRGCKLQYEGCKDKDNASTPNVTTNYSITPFTMNKLYNDCSSVQDFMCQQNVNCLWKDSSCSATDESSTCIPAYKSCWTLKGATNCSEMDHAKCIRNTNNCVWDPKNKTCNFDTPCEEASVSHCNQWVDSCIGGTYDSCVACADETDDSTCSSANCQYTSGVCFTVINSAIMQVSTIAIILLALFYLVNL